MKALVLATVVGLSTISGAHTSLKSELEGLNLPISAAFMRRDIDAFQRIVQGHITSDFVYTEGDTTMNFSQLVARLRMKYSTYERATKASIRVIAVDEKRATATAIERQEVEAFAKGPGKKKIKLDFVGLSTETFRKVNGQWKMATMSVKTLKLSMNANEMPYGGKVKH